MVMLQAELKHTERRLSVLAITDNDQFSNAFPLTEDMLKANALQSDISSDLAPTALFRHADGDDHDGDGDDASAVLSHIANRRVSFAPQLVAGAAAAEDDDDDDDDDGGAADNRSPPPAPPRSSSSTTNISTTTTTNISTTTSSSTVMSPQSPSASSPSRSTGMASPASASATLSSSSSSSSSSSTPYAPDYKRMWSQQYARHYYVATATQQPQWEAPTSGIIACT